MNKNTLNIIDCTFRDGGYYTDWFFEKNLVEKTLKVLSKLPIDVVEIGFRQFKGEKNYGEYAYSTEKFLNSLAIPGNLKIAVMVETSYLNLFDETKQRKLFVPKVQSHIAMIRVCAYFKDFEKAKFICGYLKEIGYATTINIIHISKHSLSEIKEKMKHLKDFDLDVIYFADTFGNLVPETVKKIAEIFKNHTDIPIGFHSHENRGLALANVLCAIDSGVEWVDGTLSGMGRGAGNVSTEALLIEMMKLINKDIGISELLELLQCYFYPLREECGWGYTSYAHYASVKNIHPFLVQKILKNKNLKPKEIFMGIDECLS